MKIIYKNLFMEEEDEELLKKESTSGRLKMAVEIRLGEKKLLQEAKKWVAATISAVQEAMQTEPSAKRQRF